MAILGGTQIFPLQNPQGTCAAYSQSWLAFSLMGGAPVTKPGMIHNQRIMSEVQTTAGGSSVNSLLMNGMSVVGNPIVMGNTDWTSAFKRLAECSPGHYYLTIKNPHHGMACIIEDHNMLYYLEPEVGLYQFKDLGVFVSGAASWYQQRTGASTNTEFKIYQVTPTGTNTPSTTGKRTLIGTHRV